MYYKEYGSKDGQLVVFIHGGFTTHESYFFDMPETVNLIISDFCQ